MNWKLILFKIKKWWLKNTDVSKEALEEVTERIELSFGENNGLFHSNGTRSLSINEVGLCEKALNGEIYGEDHFKAFAEFLVSEGILMECDEKNDIDFIYLFDVWSGKNTDGLL